MFYQGIHSRLISLGQERFADLETNRRKAVHIRMSLPNCCRSRQRPGTEKTFRSTKHMARVQSVAVHMEGGVGRINGAEDYFAGLADGNSFISEILWSAVCLQALKLDVRDLILAWLKQGFLSTLKSLVRSVSTLFNSLYRYSICMVWRTCTLMIKRIKDFTAHNNKDGLCLFHLTQIYG